MTTADSGTEQPAPPSVRPLLRSRDDRVLAGVAGGLGRWLDVDPVIFRVTFGLLTLFGGLGIIAYLIGYLLIPDESTGEALVSSRLLPDLRRLTHQQRALLGWGAAGLCVLIAIAGHRSTTVAVLIIVAAVAVLSARAATPRTQRPQPFSTPQQYGPQREYPYSQAYTPPPGATVPPSAAFTAPTEPTTTWQPQQPWQPQQEWQPQQPLYSEPAAPAPAPKFLIKHRGRRLNKALISAAVLAVGVYLILGRAGAYDPTVLAAMAVGLTALGAGLAATAWYARSRGALVLGVLLTALVLAGSAIQGNAGSSIGNRHWTPTSTTAIPATYKLGVGHATLDLTQLGPAALGKTIKVTMGIGELSVIVPNGLPVSVYAHVPIGDFRIFGNQYDNDPVKQTVYTPGWTAATGIRIEAQLRIGNVEVNHG
jgi:phage shock protein PspC (stress-responsive transcriptional regulator)